MTRKILKKKSRSWSKRPKCDEYYFILHIKVIKSLTK